MKKKIAIAGKKWSLRVKILTLYYAVMDSRTPWYAKLTAASSLFYLISPVDIIPDVIPFLGYADDLVIVPLLMSISTMMLPPEIKRISEERARRQGKKAMWLIIIALILLLGLTALLIYYLLPHH
jgi:uncharacterized membrane protein YkvA (DUF1232 family)